ncbi:response regulator transcription factor [Streptomyces sp. NPDC053253]|uniref:response regulator transcription factor n=1 Tax=Streptomyces sp. NPDC053253 TaxID=3365699 RepID=UPI0037D51E58
MTRLLIVEDDPDLALALRVLLTRHGYEVSVAADGREGLRLLFAERPALMVLDLLLPELDGWEVLDRTRDMSDLPVLVLSGLGGVDDRVRGLRSGADDYLVKPFDRTELLARVEALLRRSGPRHWVGAHVEEDLRLVPERRAALWQGGEIRLSDIEYRLLQVLVRNRGRVVTLALALAVVSIVPFLLWGPVYRREFAPDRSRIKGLLWGFGLWLYAYHLFIVSARGFVRLVRGRTGWAKTRRNSETAGVGPVATES